ncbi:PKD domain-containing protein [Arcticibacter svalbardensis]|uniref:PKD domain-containing protein n=1 Tax=Arcticibacter svalbardensis TaxID=1288027 RepID=UPI00058BFB42|nr:PKD domain-containing protein [Arcticibacter svalbardensis]
MAQTITIGVVPTGPYGVGSDITVPITLEGSFKKDCKFELYLSDVSGSFVNPTLIGVFDSHFTTFVNGVIPAGTPAGTGYLLQIRVIESDSQVFVTCDHTITINDAIGPNIKVSPSDNQILVPNQIWGYNPSKIKDDNHINLVNETVGDAVVTGTLINDYEPSKEPSNIVFNAYNNYIIHLEIGYYTVVFNAIDKGIISSKSYVILNSTLNLSPQMVGEPLVCIRQSNNSNTTSPDNGIITFYVDVNPPNGENTDKSIFTNYPGLIYRFEWGDGETDYLSQHDLIDSKGYVKHQYKKSSCGQPVINLPSPNPPIYDAYSINIVKESSIYSEVVFPKTEYAKVFLAPEADFIVSGERGCVGRSIVFDNTTIPGKSQDVSGDGTSCTEFTSYNWYIKKSTDSEWNRIPSQQPSLDYKFLSAGTYNIKLEAWNHSCLTTEKIKDICIEPDPVLDFIINQTGDCTPTTTLEVTNKTSEVGFCKITYLWEVLDSLSGKVVKDNIIFQTPDTSASPKINIIKPGSYILRLSVSSACGEITLEKPFLVAGPLTVDFPLNGKEKKEQYCIELPHSINFSSDENHIPTYEGFGKDKRYQWQVSGGVQGVDYDFENNSESKKYAVIKFLTPGEYKVNITYRNECNVPVTDIQNITFYGPIIVQAGEDAVVCDNVSANNINTSYILNANVPESYQGGKWTVEGGPEGSFFDGETKPKAIISNLKPGVYELMWSISNLTCTASDVMKLTVYAKPEGGTVSGPSSVCIGDSGTLTSVGAVGKIVGWESSLDNVNWNPIPNTANNTYSFANLQLKTYFRVVVGSEGSTCLKVVNSLILEVSPDPISVGGTTSGENTFCINTNTATPILLTEGTYTGKIIGWQEITDDGAILKVFKSTANPFTTNSNLTKTTQFRAVVKSGECSISYSTATIISIIPAPTKADAGDDIACLVSPNYILQGNEPLVGKGMWTEESGLIKFDDPTKYNATASPVQKGNRYKFTWTISNGVCDPSTSTATIDILQDIINTIKADKPVSCVNDAVSLSTNVLSGGDVPDLRKPKYTFVWESSLDNGVSWKTMAISTENITVTPNVTTTYRRKVTSWESCEIYGVGSTVTITVNPSTPLSKAGDDQVLCNVKTFQLDGNNPGAFIGTWKDLTKVSSLKFVDEHLFDTEVTDLEAGKIYDLQWTIGGTAPCPSQLDQVKITNRKAVTVATVGIDQHICIKSDNSNNHIVLTGNSPDAANGETGIWKQVDEIQGLIIKDPTLYNTEISGLVSGTYTLEWKITSDATSLDLACKESKTELTIKVTAYPIAGTISGGNVSLCQGNPAGELTLENYSTADLLQWESSSATAGFTPIDNAITATFQPGSLLETTKYRVKITQAGGCAISVFTPVVEIKVDVPTVGGITRSDVAQVCIGDNSGTIVLNGYLGSVVRWESSVDNQEPWIPINTTGSSYDFTNLSKSTWFRAVVRNGACSLEFSTAVFIDVLPMVTVANAGEDQYTCNETVIYLQGNLEGDPAVNGRGVWTQVSGPLGVIEEPTLPGTQVNGLIPGVYEFKWTISNGICAPTEDNVTINNYPVLVNQLGGDVTICSGQGVSNIGPLPTGGDLVYKYQWEISSNNIDWSVVKEQTSVDYTAVFITSTYIKRTVKSGPCSVTSNAIFVTVQPPLGNNEISEIQDVCLGDLAAKITGTLPTGGDKQYSYQWQKSIDKTTWIDLKIESTQIDFQDIVLSESTWYRRVVTTALCNGDQESVSNEIKVTVNPLSKAEFSASTLKSCVPFDLKAVISVEPYEDRNASYEWFANGASIGSGKDFPGYTLIGDGEHVIIKLVTKSKFGCKDDSRELEFATVENVKANFTKDKIKGCGPLTVNFINTSSPLVGADYLWDFGNGQTSKLEQPGAIDFQPHPLHRDTTYIITLTASTACQSTVFTESVLVRAMPKVTFSPDKTTGCSPLVVNFSNQSTGIPNTYTYDFGDGGNQVISDNSEVTHTYHTDKTITVMVTLTAVNECGTDTYTYPIVIYPNTVTAELVVDGDRKFGCAPFVVKFDNNSLGANDFYWDFKDGETKNTTSAPESVYHTFTIPGTYEVSLLASNGCSFQTTTEIITVYPIPDASFTLPGGEYCMKNPVAFFSKDAPSNIYNWDFGDGTTSDVANPIHVFTMAGVFNVKLIVFQPHPDGNKCPSTTTQQIEILPLPFAQFISNSYSLNCVPFKMIVSSTPADAANVEWNFGDSGSGDNFAIGYTAEHVFTKPGLYKVQEIAYNAAGCTETLIKTIKITERPQAEFTASSTLICGKDATISFVNQSTYEGTDIVVYRWFIDNVEVSKLKDFAYTFNIPSGAIMPFKYEIKMIALNTQGCPGTAIHTVQFNPLPKADFESIETIACAPFKLKITNKSQYADQYAWYLNGVLVSNEATPAGIILSEPDQTYTLKLVCTNIYGCEASSIEKTILTYPKPKADFTLLESVSCNGKLDIKISNTSIRATKYEWDFGDNTPISTESEPSHIYGQPGVYYLQLTAKSDFCTDTQIQTIRIAASPEAAFTSDITKGCTQIDVLFQNISVNASSYLWDFGDGTFSTTKNPNHIFSYIKSPFSVKLTAFGEFGCSDITVLTNYIQVTAPPVADFDVLPASVIKIPDYTFTFKNTSTGDPVTQQWSFGDGKFSTEESPSHTYINTGVHDVQLVVTNVEGCTNTLVKTVQIDGVPGYLYVPSGFEPESFKNELKTFIPKGSGIAKYTIKIYNKWGEMIWQSDKLDENGTPTEGWDGQMAGQMAPQGVYVWEISATFIDGNKWTGMKYETGAARTVGSVHLIR